MKGCRIRKLSLKRDYIKRNMSKYHDNKTFAQAKHKNEYFKRSINRMRHGRRNRLEGALGTMASQTSSPASFDPKAWPLTFSVTSMVPAG